MFIRPFSIVLGSAGDDDLFAGPAPSIVVAFRGADTTFGGADDDLILAGAGDDLINASGGDDRVSGGSGFDTAVYGAVLDYDIALPAGPAAPLVLTDTTGVTGTDRLVDIEAVFFEADAYTLFLDGTNNAVFTVDDTAEVAEDTVLTLAAADLIANDIEFDGDTITLTGVEATTAAGGTVALINGEVIYDQNGAFDDLNDGETAFDTISYTVDDGNGGTATGTVTVQINGVTDAVPLDARINEIHYDDESADEGEFVEVRVTAGADASGLLLELYNGNGGAVYASAALTDGDVSTDGVFDYYVLDISDLGTSGIQNGSPDGLALSNDGALIEFLSYEGTFDAVGGTADGVTSTDFGVAEGGATPAGFSLQRLDGDLWDGPRAETRGADNTAVAGAVFLNEISVSSTGTPDFEFFELFGTAGTSLDGFSLVQVAGDPGFEGDVLTVISLDGQTIGADGFFLAASPEAEVDFGVTGDLQIPDDSFENFSSTFLLVQDFAGAEGDDLDADGDGVLDAALTVVDDVAIVGDGTPLVYSDTVIGPDGTFLAPGARRTEDGAGEFVQTSFSSTADYTPGESNVAPVTPTLISAVQGSGDESPLAGEGVRVTAVVTLVVSNGFFLQEEDSDADGDSATSEGIFVFTGGAPTVAVGDLVQVDGTVVEFGTETQIGSVSAIEVLATDQTLPTAAAVLVGPSTTLADYEAVEGMRVSVTSATDDALTVTANFNLDRFGELQVAAGTKTQPTQLFDPDTEAAEIAAAIAANENNTLLLDDGSSGFDNQNPTEFTYIPVAEAQGDNGNGFLDAADDFSMGATVRIGAEITAPVLGVMDVEERFGEVNYKVNVTEQIAIDEATNSGDRPATPEDVGGNLTIVSANVENYFATLDDANNTVGPNDLDPRGAATQADLDRQTDKLVPQLLTTGGDVFALQELGNDGFGADGSIATLTAALNDAAATTYAFADPFGNGASTDFIGTDAITTGIVYDTAAVTLVYSDFLVFDEASAATTFDLAEVLNPFASSDDQVGDFQRNRPAVAATFQDNETGEYFTVVSVHFKSKGDSNLEDVVLDAQAAGAPQADIDALLADPNYDQGDGQGFWNQVREDAAIETTDWVEGDYATAASAAAGTDVSGNVLILGDFNAYAEEDPTDAVRDDPDGYVDIIDTFVDGGQDEAFSFIFDGQQGTLDQAFASDDIAADITGATEWHVNAQEPDLLGYDSTFTDAGFYDDNLFGASDHDPLIVGIDFGGVAVA